MPGAGAGKRRSAPGMAMSNANATGRVGGTANEAQAPTSTSVISSSAAPTSVSAAAVATATTSPPAALVSAAQSQGTAPPVAASPPGLTPSAVSPSRSMHSSHSPSHHRSSTRHRLVQVRLVPADGRQRSPEADTHQRSRNRARAPANAPQCALAPVAVGGSGDQDTSTTRFPRLLPKRLAELSGHKPGTGSKKIVSKVSKSSWQKRKHPLPVSPLATPPGSRGPSVSHGEIRVTEPPATTTPPTQSSTITQAPMTTGASVRPPQRPVSRSSHRPSSRSPRRSPTRSPPQMSIPHNLNRPTSRNAARATQSQAPVSSSVAPTKAFPNSLPKTLSLNSSKVPIPPTKIPSGSSPKGPLHTFSRIPSSTSSKVIPNASSNTPNSLSRTFTRARFSHVPRTPFQAVSKVDPINNSSLSDPSKSIPSGPPSIGNSCPLSDPTSGLPNNSPRAPITNVIHTQTPQNVTPSAPPFRGLRAFLNERKMRCTSANIPKSTPSSGALTDLGSLSELPTSTPIDASVLSSIYASSQNTLSPTALTQAALPLVRACFRMMQRSSGNEHQLQSNSVSSRLSSATVGDFSDISMTNTSKSKDQSDKKYLETMNSLNSKPKDRLEKSSQKSREILGKGSINPLRGDALDCKTLSQCSSNTVTRALKRKTIKEAATSTGNFLERKYSINAAEAPTMDTLTTKKSMASQTSRASTKIKSPVSVSKVKPTSKKQKEPQKRTSSTQAKRPPSSNTSVERRLIRSKISGRQRTFPKANRKKIVKHKEIPELRKQASKTSIRSKCTQTRIPSREKEDTVPNNPTRAEASEPCPLKDYDLRLSGLPVLLWPSPFHKHSNQEGSGDVMSKAEAQIFQDRMVMVPAHRVEQALGLLQRQQRLLQSVLRTTPEGPPASRSGDHHRREKWGAVTPKGSKSPTAKRKTGTSSATDVRRTRKRSRKNKKRKTVQGVEG